MPVQIRPTTEALAHVRAEYLDMPGLKLTEQQAERLFHLDCAACETVLETLVSTGFLRRADDGLFVRFGLVSDQKRDAASCEWGTPTLFLPAPLWLSAWDSPWTCVRDATPQILGTTEKCATCARWRPRRRDRDD